MPNNDVIAENEQGYKLVQVGENNLGGYIDKRVVVM